jgi:hypothetical protein
VLVVALLVALAFVLLRDDRQRADLSPGPDQGRPDRAGATSELLYQLQEALTAPSGTDLSELADPDLAPAERQLAHLVDNVRDLRVDRLALRYLDVADLELSAGQRERFGPDAWVSEVQLSWRFRGVDSAVSTLEVPIVADWEDDRAVFVTSRVTGDHRVPLWFTEPLAVRRGARTLVLAADARLARSLDRQARIAVATVRRTLPDFDGPLVLEAPGSSGDFRTAAGVSREASQAIAAVTTTTDGSVLEDAPVRVYLNPEVFGPLGPVGRQIVVSHEATHVALGATRTEAPLWLSEGIADYVALVGTSLPDTVLAAQIRSLVRKDGPPEALPGEVEFDGSNQDIGAWYEAAWLAVRLLGETYGQQALLDFYEQVEQDGDTRRAFREVLGTTEAAFRQAWQDQLAELAR